MARSRDPAEGFLPLTPGTFHILLAVAESPRHGYAIMKAVSRQSGGRVRVGPGTLYEAVDRLLDRGLLAEADAPAGAPRDARRRYYRLTPRGRRVLALEAERLADLIEVARDAGVRTEPA